MSFLLKHTLILEFLAIFLPNFRRKSVPDLVYAVAHLVVISEVCTKNAWFQNATSHSKSSQFQSKIQCFKFLQKTFKNVLKLIELPDGIHICLYCEFCA